MINKIIIILSFLLVTMTSAQNTRYSAEFLELGVSAKALGMGSANVSLSNDVTSPFWNPAGLAFVPKLQVASLYADLFNSMQKQSYIGAAMPLFGGTTLSFSWVRLSIEGIDRHEYDPSLDGYTALQRISDPTIALTYEPDGTFGSYDDAYYISFAKHLPLNLDIGWQYWEMPIDMAFGLNVKMINLSLDKNSGSGVGIDLGYIFKLGLDKIFVSPYYGDLSIGLSVQDLFNTRITWDTEKNWEDEIGRNFKTGFSYSQPIPIISSRMTVAYDVDTRYDGLEHVGFEYIFSEMLAVRIGSNSGYMTTGAGIYIWKFKFDYAYQSHDLGNSHRVSLLFGL
ncbi:MAG: hypothetical protein JW956_03665 [Calditrichaceae bacterium]|nr:hypothetical protein [Calditrichaceae bacterium]